jgi:hypothetical protein
MYVNLLVVELAIIKNLNDNILFDDGVSKMSKLLVKHFILKGCTQMVMVFPQI